MTHDSDTFTSRVVQPSPSQSDTPLRVQLFPVKGRIAAIDERGLVHVHSGGTVQMICEVLAGVGTLAVGDAVLATPLAGDDGGVVLGRLGAYVAPEIQRRGHIEASERLTLKCGQSSIDLRADGKVMIRGEDVLVRAKGTKRIRAGTVSIN